MAHFSALLPSPVGHHYYTTFYVLAFLLNQALLLWEGHRRGYPLRSWLLLTTAVTLAFIVGTKLIAVPAAEWPALWQHGQWPSGTARSILGGAISGTLVGLVLRRWLGYGWHAFDAFCLPMCAAYALQCLGCLLTGCCFGHVADWGVTYAPGSLPYLVQLERGLIGPDAAHSLPLIPTQALTGLLSLGVGLVLWRLRHRAWAGGSWRLLHVGLLLLSRFVLEFWRDPAGEQVGATVRTVAGLSLKQVQWALLPLTVLMLGWWLWRTRPAQPVRAETVPPNYPLRNLLGVVALLAATALLGVGALTLPEMLVIKSGLTVVLALEVAALIRRGAAKPRRLGLPLGLASAVLLFTNQAPAPTDSAQVRRSFTLGLGAAQGRYDEDVVDGGGCSGTRTRTAYYHRYAVVGGTAEYNLQNPARAFRTLGLGIWGGTERIGVQSLALNGPFLTTGEDGHVRRGLWDINPYVEYRSRTKPWGFGYRFGLHLGQLDNSAQVLRRETTGTGGRPLQVRPDLMLWTGVRRVAFLQFEAGTGPLALGNYSYQLSLGSGLGANDGGQALAGVSFAEHAPSSAMGFASAQIHLGHSGLLLEPYAATNFGRHHQLRAQLRYRLPLNPRGH